MWATLCLDSFWWLYVFFNPNKQIIVMKRLSVITRHRPQKGRYFSKDSLLSSSPNSITKNFISIQRIKLSRRRRRFLLNLLPPSLHFIFHMLSWAMHADLTKRLIFACNKSHKQIKRSFPFFLSSSHKKPLFSPFCPIVIRRKNNKLSIVHHSFVSSKKKKDGKGNIER